MYKKLRTDTIGIQLKGTYLNILNLYLKTEKLSKKNTKEYGRTKYPIPILNIKKIFFAKPLLKIYRILQNHIHQVYCVTHCSIIRKNNRSYTNTKPSVITFQSLFITNVESYLLGIYRKKNNCGKDSKIIFYNNSTMIFFQDIFLFFNCIHHIWHNFVILTNQVRKVSYYHIGHRQYVTLK